MSRYELMVHERNRWSYMTEEQLARRLKKITKLEKLSCFELMAENRDNSYLMRLAKERKQDLLIVGVAYKAASNGGARLKAEVKRKWEVVKEQEINERYLDL